MKDSRHYAAIGVGLALLLGVAAGFSFAAYQVAKYWTADSVPCTYEYKVADRVELKGTRSRAIVVGIEHPSPAKDGCWYAIAYDGTVWVMSQDEVLGKEVR